MLCNRCLDPHKNGHTLDLVLSYDLPVLNFEVCETVFSDHVAVLFDASPACTSVKAHVAMLCSRIVNSSTAVQFSAAFERYCLENEFMCSGAEGVSSYQITCQTVLDTVAPLKR